MTTTIDRTTTDALVGAKTLIVQRGWVTGNYVDEAGYCLEGAVRLSVGGNTNDTVASRDASRALVLALRRRGFSVALAPGALDEPGKVVIDWNDHHCKSAGEAIALIDEALLMLAPDRPTEPTAPIARTGLRERVRQLVGV